MVNELIKRNIPDFFVNNGKKIETKQEWEDYRPYLKELLLKEEYGFLPPKIIPTVRVEKEGVDFAGKAEWESVYFTFENNGKSHTVKTGLILPKGKEKCPVFLSLNFQKEIPNKYLPVEEIIDTGFGIFAFCYEEVTADNNDFTNGLCGLFEENGKCPFGKISLWAYFASICMDYLEKRQEVDKNSVAIIGHSRLGKTALLTSALDERFKLTCVNDSGCCGAAVSRGKSKENETIEKITETFPFWFTDGFKQYVNNESSLPFDQHMLLALVAPRCLIVGGAEEDAWADNKGQHLSCALAAKAWELYDKGLADKRLNYYERRGTHFLSRTDWIVYMEGFKEILKNEI
ncbi:MAG: hypothetical protein IJX02_08595 [Clostridia bacterium]|nr:hypothetical protein [Clostridia bacterium]